MKLQIRSMQGVDDGSFPGTVIRAQEDDTEEIKSKEGHQKDYNQEDVNDDDGDISSEFDDGRNLQ